MNIDDAARATRKYLWVHGFVEDVDTGKMLGPFETHRKAQAACDRLNLIAVLEAIREPTQTMVDAAPREDLRTLHGGVYVYRAMIDALIAEVGK